MPAALALREEVSNAEPSPPPTLRLVGSSPCPHVAELDVELVLTIADLNARRLLRLGSIRADDLGDVTQEFVTEALTCWPWFDQRRSAAATFMTLLMRRRASSMVRTRRAVKRGGDRRSLPLDQITQSLEPDHHRSHFDQALLRLDVRAVLAGLPLHQRRLCGLIAQMSVSAAARKLRVPRHSLLRQIQQIRQRFVNAGMEGYR
jgi:DNA-directed RNA polymerase specialized sigma24 family protein